MSESKDKVREQLAQDIKNYLARGKVIKRYHYNEPAAAELDEKYDLVEPSTSKRGSEDGTKS